MPSFRQTLFAPRIPCFLLTRRLPSGVSMLHFCAEKPAPCYGLTGNAVMHVTLFVARSEPRTARIAPVSISFHASRARKPELIDPLSPAGGTLTSLRI